MTSWAAPVNMMANVLDNLQQDPQVAQMMLGIGPAYDVVKNVPIDLLSNIPHYESEVEGSHEYHNSGAINPGNPEPNSGTV